MKKEQVKPSRCEACDRGEKKFKPLANSIFPKSLTMHKPSNFICLNDIPDAWYEILTKKSLARERGDTQ